MKKLELKYRKLLRKIFGCVSFTAVAFVFQACYGVPHDVHDMRFTGTVKSKNTNLPIKGINVSVMGGFDEGMTDENGNFNFSTEVYTDRDESRVRVEFLDIDSTENGYFADTSITVPISAYGIELHVLLNEKQ